MSGLVPDSSWKVRGPVQSLQGVEQGHDADDDDEWGARGHEEVEPSAGRVHNDVGRPVLDRCRDH
jgi:hypothetical protein